MNQKEIEKKVNNLRNAEYIEVRKFLKNTSYCVYSKHNKHPHVFWNSELPEKWFDNLIEEPFLEELLFSYFSHDKNVNKDFLDKKMRSSKKGILIKIVKLSEVFEKQDHWESFLLFKWSIDLAFHQFYNELSYIRDYRLDWDKKTSSILEELRDIPYEDFLIEITSYYERFKSYSSKIKNAPGYEHHLISIINTVLNEKKKYLIDNKLTGEQYTIEEFEGRCKEVFPPFKEKKNKLKNDCRAIIEFLFQKEESENKIQKYLTGFAQFTTNFSEFNYDLESEIAVNNEYKHYRASTEKGRFDETYLWNQVCEDKEFIHSLESKDFWEKKFHLLIKRAVGYFDLLKIPNSIYKDRSRKIKIDTEKVFILLQNFSTLLFPQDDYLKKDIPQEFKQLFDVNYITSFEQENLINSCVQYFGWNKDEVENIIDYLITDLDSNRSFEIDITKRPLLKIGGKIIWLSSFFRDRRWEIFLHKRIASDKHKNLIEQPAQTEKYIAELFKKVNFGSVSSHCYTNNDGIRGEIDVLAYKNNTLFILELKSTYVEEDIMKTSKYETLKFNSLAYEQLNKAKDYINDSFEKVKAIEELGIDCDLKDLKIHPLIISNIYQSDHLVINNEYFKTSLFELMIILKNDLYSMLSDKASEHVDLEMIPIEFYLNEEITEDGCNLWKDKNNCMPNDIIEAIKDYKVWKYQAVRHRNTHHKITKFDEEKKFLAD